MWHVWERREVYMVSVGKLKEREHSEDLIVDERMRSEWILGRLAVGRMGLSGSG
jgi:hypothetical protein